MLQASTQNVLIRELSDEGGRKEMSSSDLRKLRGRKFDQSFKNNDKRELGTAITAISSKDIARSSRHSPSA